MHPELTVPSASLLLFHMTTQAVPRALSDHLLLEEKAHTCTVFQTSFFLLIDLHSLEVGIKAMDDFYISELSSPRLSGYFQTPEANAKHLR